MNSHKVQIRVNNYIFKLKNRLSVWGGVRSVVCKPIFLPEIILCTLYLTMIGYLLNKCSNILKIYCNI